MRNRDRCRDGRVSMQVALAEPAARMLRCFGSKPAARAPGLRRQSANPGWSGTVRRSSSCGFAGTIRKPLHAATKRRLATAAVRPPRCAVRTALCCRTQDPGKKLKNFVEIFNYSSTFFIFKMVY